MADKARRRLPRGSYVQSKAGKTERERLDKGSLLWIPEEGRYELAEVTQRDSSILQLQRVHDGRTFALDLEEPDVDILKANRGVADDMTELRHLHLPAILHNLRERALEDKPYTFLGGSVLVAVNPLKPIADPDGALGDPSALRAPHPFAIAESAYQQLCFAAARAAKRKSKGGRGRADSAAPMDDDGPVNQSILVGGESGSGKTVSSKMVLRHLVQRCLGGKDDERDLDRRLLDSAPILESFGNAATLRNHNSSRHGRCYRLFMTPSKNRNANAAAFEIAGAAVETYLLERSRVTAHASGEGAFHVFGALLAGASKSQRKALDLDRRFDYLVARKDVLAGETGSGKGKAPRRANASSKSSVAKLRSLRASRRKLEANYATTFEELGAALETIGVPSKAKTAPDDDDDDDDALAGQDQLWAALAGVLHLGNAAFKNDASGTAGDVAVETDARPLETAAALLGLKPAQLRALVLERRVRAGGEDITAPRDAASAKDAVDGVAKEVYAVVFDWLVARISQSLDDSVDSSGRVFINILDIFGFESFTTNSLEQLLINYANEALQSSFAHAIFDAEAALYAREGLLVASEDLAPPTANAGAMTLLRGATPNTKRRGVSRSGGGGGGGARARAKDAAKRQPGLLDVIDAEGRAPQPLDEKMNDALHRAFGAHPNFVEPHPRERRRVFIVTHFAGDVKYTVGQFLEKNADRAPPEVAHLFAGSESALLRAAFAPAAPAGTGGGGSSKKKKNRVRDGTLARAGRSARALTDSVIARFTRQMDDLVASIDATRSSYVRCVKPNPFMEREDGDGGAWFDDAFVELQLENLSIPQTTQVLQGGFPTRVPFDQLTEPYVALLPEPVLRVWRTVGGGDDRAFVTALFYAFEIEPRFYKLGLSRVFFRAGMLDKLAALLDAATAGPLDDDIVQRFRRSFARTLWRRTLAKVRAALAFEALLEFSRARNGAATVLQRMARQRLAEAESKAELARLREERRAREDAEAKRQAKAARRREREARKAAEAAEKQRLREAEMLRAEQVRQDKLAAEQEEAARLAAVERDRVKQFREQAERDEKEARLKEKQETQRTVRALGGEEAYIAQKQRERGIRFSRKVRVREFRAYFTDENAEALQPKPAYDDTEGAKEDLDALAPLVRVVTADGVVEAIAAGRGPARGKTAANGYVPPPDEVPKPLEEVPERRRSYAPSRSTARTAEVAARARAGLRRDLGSDGGTSPALAEAALTLGKLSCDDVQFCVEFAVPRGRRRPTSSSSSSGASRAASSISGRTQGSSGRSINRGWLSTLLRGATDGPATSSSSSKTLRRPPRVTMRPPTPDDSDDEAPGRMQRRDSGPVYTWASCFLLLEGFQLRWYRKFRRDAKTGEMHGVAELGRADAEDVVELERFAPGAKVVKLRKERHLENILRLGVRGLPGFRLALRFGDEETCEEWSQRIQEVLSAYREERRAVKRFWRGEHSGDVAMEEYRSMLASGVISKREFKAAVGQQVSSEEEYAEQQVALVGEDAYDKRVVCETCRAVNFLVEPDEDDRFWCHSCGTELVPPDVDASVAVLRALEEMRAAASEQAVSNGDKSARARRTAVQSRKARAKSDRKSAAAASSGADSGSVVLATPSLQQPALAAGPEAAATFPVTVLLPDKSQLTVFAGELLPRQRLDVRTRERKYFYSFRCQFQDRKAESQLQHWHLDKPFDAFEGLDAALREFAAQWNHALTLPAFRDAEYDPEPEKRAAARLHVLNGYMAELLAAATEQPVVFQAAPARIFFNLRAVQVAPLSPSELRGLRDAFDAFAEFTRSGKRATRELMKLYEDVSALYPRIEATADEELLFNSTEMEVARLSHAEKGDMFRTAQDYLQILEGFEQKILSQLGG